MDFSVIVYFKDTHFIVILSIHIRVFLNFNPT